MSRRAIPFLVGVLASLALASSAQAAVSFSFTATEREPAQINRGDEYASYLVKLKNIGTTPTTAVTSVVIHLPSGAELSLGTGSGWSCDLQAQICSSSQVVAAGGEFDQLRMRVWLYPDLAPDTVTAKFVALGGGAASSSIATDTFSFGPEALFGIEGFDAAACAEPPAAPGPGLCSSALGAADFTRAGGHPFAATSALKLPTHTSPVQEPVAVGSGLRDLNFDLPPGFTANPEAAALCSVVKLGEKECAEASAVGEISLALLGDPNEPPAPIYRIEPEEGYPAAFAFRPVPISGLTVVLRAKVRSNGDYGATAVSPLPPQAPQVVRVKFARLCGFGVKIEDQGGGGLVSKGCKKAGEPGANQVPLLSNPTRCSGEAPVTRVHAAAWENPGAKDAEEFPDLSDPSWKSAEAISPQSTECEPLTEAWAAKGPTSPSFAFRPDSSRAATAAAYTARLTIPQQGLEEANGVATAHLKDTTVTLPRGVVLNPAAADGLGACSEAQAGYLGDHFGSPNPMRFSTVSPGCPDNSKIGNVEVSTPLLDHPLPGSIYLAAQGANPFGSDFATYLVVDDEVAGIKATLAGEVDPSDGEEGRITATFLNNPQVPVDEIEVSFFGGPRASLANPDVCADYTTQTALTPWSAKDPDNPTAAETAFSDDTVAIDAPAAGQGSCPGTKGERPFDLGFAARSTSPIAGAHTPFTLRITRPDGNQEIRGVSVTTPAGFAAILKGTATCSAAGVAQALSRTATGDGALELASPSCPASSQVATTTIGAGTGPTPFYLRTGRAYLTGPYKGAPLSFTFVVPAVAGPFDLGVQVVRTALNVNPKTGQVTAVSDPIPEILRGVPLQIRDIRVDLDRPSFAFNPTSCEAKEITARLSGGSGAVANLANHFQVGGCEGLKFKPGLKLQLHGGTERADYQRLEATVTYPKGSGYANIARAAVTLPHSAFLAQEHIKTVCTRVQFAAKACPKGSIYGHATATTPILADPISGPVYLRSSDNLLPDLVVALRGPDSMPIEVELAGRTDSKHGGIRNTFDLVPDAPVSKFTLNLFGGGRSLIVNSRDLCKSKQRATVRFTAQNGKTSNFRPLVGNDCGKKGKKNSKR